MKQPEFPINIDLSSMQSVELGKFQKVLRNLSMNSIYFENFTRRKFHIPRGYILWDEFVGDLSFNLMAADNISLDAMDYASINSALLLRNIYNEQSTIFPCYWLNENLMQAFLNTKLPRTMEIKRSHFYGTIFLPKNLLRSPDGHSVNWIMFAHHLKGEFSKAQFPSHRSSVVQDYPEDMLQVFTAVGKYNTLYFSGCSLERTDENKLPYREKTLIDDKEIDSPEETKFVDTLLSITMHCLLWLQRYQPAESIPGGVGFGGNIKSKKPSPPQAASLFNPRWIGKDYQIKRVAPIVSALQGSGSRMPPRTHWREGHWRNQRIGVGRQHSKLTWLEPFLVNY